jgi:hypothetical protein
MYLLSYRNYYIKRRYLIVLLYVVQIGGILLTGTLMTKIGIPRIFLSW